MHEGENKNVEERFKSLREEIKGSKAKEEHTGSRGKTKGEASAKGDSTSAKEEIQKLGWEIQGADSAKGENKMHDGYNEL